MQDAFATLAEISVGVAGFGSIAIVLAREEGWSGSDLFRVSSFLMASLGALLLSLVALGLLGSALGERAALRSVSALLFVSVLVFTLVNLRLRRRHLDPELYFGPLLLATLALSGVAVLGAQVASCVGPWQGSATAPFFGIVWLLAYACLVLVRVLFFRPLGSGEAP